MPELNEQWWQRIEGGELFLLFVCLIVSAIFAGAETALTALSEVKARAIVEEGIQTKSCFKRSLRLWLDKPHHVLTAILIGNHAANTAVAVMASLIALDAFRSTGIAVLVAVLVVLLLVFGEITPRSFAKHNANTLAPFFFPLVIATYVITLPLVVLFTRFSHVVVRATGGAVTRSGPFVTEDDIVSMITLGRKEGVLGKIEGRMLASVIELGETLVKELMVPRTDISSLSVTATFDEVMAEVKEQGHSRLPVYDGTLDEVKGFFHTKDLLLLDDDARASFRLRDYLRPVLFVPELMRVSDLLKLFQKKKTHLAVVVDEFGGTAGVVALEDVLEEIVGPIHDEHDEEEAEIKKVDGNRYLVEGRASLYELGEALGIAFPTEGGYETLGGFLIARCGRMPRTGDRVAYHGWTFMVRDADEKRVSRIDVERQQNASAVPTEVEPVVVPEITDEHAPAPGPVADSVLRSISDESESLVDLPEPE